jgi:hypothetical protein
MLVTGAEDDSAFPLQAQRLHSEVPQRYSDPQRVDVTSILGTNMPSPPSPASSPRLRPQRHSSSTRP